MKQSLLLLILLPISVFSQESYEDILNKIYKDCIDIQARYVYIDVNRPVSFFRGYINPKSRPRCWDCVYPRDSTLLDKFVVKVPKDVRDSLYNVEIATEEDSDLEALLLTPAHWDQKKLSSRLRVTDDAFELIRPDHTSAEKAFQRGGDKEYIRKAKKLDKRYFAKPLYQRSFYAFSKPLIFYADSVEYLFIQTEFWLYNKYSQKFFLFKKEGDRWSKLQALDIDWGQA